MKGVRCFSVQALNATVATELNYRLLKVIEVEPDISQRELARRLGISLGKVNYCLQALIAKGWLKVQNFTATRERRRAYAYYLTRKGVQQKARVTRDSLVVMAFVSAVAFFAAPLAVRLLGGAAFAPAVPIFRILLLSMLGMTVSAVMGSQWISRGLFAQVSIIAVTLATIAVVANWLVVPTFGMYGAAWVTVGLYTLALFINGGLAVLISRRVNSGTAAPAVMSQDVAL